MSISTYTELQTAVTNWLHRSGLSDRVPELIALGEAQLNRAIVSPQMEATTTVSTSTSDRYAATPTDALEVTSLVNAYGVELTQRMPSDLMANTAVGLPVEYALTYRIEFDRVSDQVYSLQCVYRKKLDIATDSTNWLLTNHPDCYLYSALLAAAPYLKKPDEAATWKAMLDAAIFAVNASVKRDVRLRCDAALIGRGNFDIVRGW